MLNIDQLLELEDRVRDVLEDNLTSLLAALNRQEKLDDFLSLIGASDLIVPVPTFESYRNGKVIIIGKSNTKDNAIRAIADEYGIGKNRLELHTEYYDAEKLDVHRMQWNPSYSLVLVGPMPHKGATTGDHGSIISALENDEGYPPVIRLLAGEQLKITNTSLRNAFQEAKNKGFIE